MKFNHFAAGAAVLLLFPVICCSCTSGKGTGKPAADTPEAVEVKTECPKTDSGCAKAEPAPEVKQEPAAPAKAEPVLEVKQEPVLVETKKEPVPAKAAPAPEVKKPVLPCKHTVKTGDNLWKISLHYYGSGAKWKQIMEANQDKIKKANYLEPGTILTIPAAKQ